MKCSIYKNFDHLVERTQNARINYETLMMKSWCATDHIIYFGKILKCCISVTPRNENCFVINAYPWVAKYLHKMLSQYYPWKACNTFRSLSCSKEWTLSVYFQHATISIHIYCFVESETLLIDCKFVRIGC